jgi:hypothetical protein
MKNIKDMTVCGFDLFSDMRQRKTKFLILCFF